MYTAAIQVQYECQICRHDVIYVLHLYAKVCVTSGSVHRWALLQIPRSLDRDENNTVFVACHHSKKWFVCFSSQSICIVIHYYLCRIAEKAQASYLVMYRNLHYTCATFHVLIISGFFLSMGS